MQSVVRVEAVVCRASQADPAGAAAQQLAQVLNASSAAGAAFAQLFSVSVESTPGCLGGLLGQKSTYQQLDLALCAPRSGAQPPGRPSHSVEVDFALDEPVPALASASTAALTPEGTDSFSRTPGVNPTGAAAAGPTRGFQGKWVLAAVVGGLLVMAGLSSLFSFRTAPPPTVALKAPGGGAPAAPVAAPPSPAGPQALNSAWFGTWKSESGLVIATFSANQLSEQITRTDGGKTSTDTVVYPWSQDITKAGGASSYVGYTAERVTAAELSKWLEGRLRPDADYLPPDAGPARRALSQLSPGVYKVVLAEMTGGDCTESKYLVDGNRMLRWGYCKYATWIDLLTRQ